MSETRPAPTLRNHYPQLLPTSTRWNDLDIFDHINNAVFYELFDSAILRVLTATESIGRDAPFAALVVESGATFHREVLFNAIIAIGLRVVHLGRSSVRYELGTFVDARAESAVDGHVTHVFVDRATRRPVDIPGAARSRLLSLQVTR